jgi:hypothetical protein
VQVSLLTADEKSGIPTAKETWAPILKKLASFPGVAKPIYQYNDYPNFSSWFDSVFGPLDAPDPTLAGKAEIEFVTPKGITTMDSRLLGARHLKSPQLASALREAMPKMDSGMLRGHLIAGDTVMELGKGTSVHPAWRRSYVHLIATGNGAPNATALKILAPDMGCYANEVSTFARTSLPANELLTISCVRISACTRKKTINVQCGVPTTKGFIRSRKNTIIEVGSPYPL